MTGRFKSEPREAIAILGWACRLPGARSPAAFWSLIEDGRQAVSTVPEDRWRLSDALIEDPVLLDAAHAWRGGFLEDVSGVDWQALRLHPREAKAMDPQHRLLLELAWEAMEDAGLPVSRPPHRGARRTGVYIGIQWNDYFRLLCREWQKLDGYSVVGNDLLYASNRISFTLDLPGPSNSIECGCASGLVALQQGCQALWSGEADQALIGAVDLILAPDSQLAMAGTGMLSKGGACRPLDAEADGFVRGEGGVVLVLKPLSRVQPDERVHALIRGVDAAHGGRAEWIMASSAATQEMAIRAACCQAGVVPSELDYVELHGTGSLRGDPIEIGALAKTLGPDRAQPCAIGSVKAQIGHLGPVAGLAGLLKVVLGMQHGRIPPSWQPADENPVLRLEERGLSPYQGGRPWTRGEVGPRRAGVTALSLGGVASHAVLEEAPESVSRDAGVLPSTFILPLSARSSEALIGLAEAYLDAIDQARDRQQVADLCYTAGHGRAHHGYRMVTTGRDAAELVQDLRRQVTGLRELPAKPAPSDPPMVTGWSLDGALVAHCASAGLAVVEADRLSGTEDCLLVLAAPGETERLYELIQGKTQVELFRLSPGQPDSLPLAFWAVAYLGGALPDFAALLPGGRICSAPTYRWQRKKMWPQWLTPERIGTPPGSPTAEQEAHPLLGQRVRVAGMSGLHVWQVPADLLTGRGMRLPMAEIAAAVAEQTGIAPDVLDYPVDVSVTTAAPASEIQIVVTDEPKRGRATLALYRGDGISEWTRLGEQIVATLPPEAEATQAVRLKTICDELASANTTSARRRLLHGYAIDLVMRVLQPEVDSTALDSAQLTDLGMDSIAVTEIKTLVKQDLSVDLPVAAIFGAETPAVLTEEMLRRYEAERLLGGVVEVAVASSANQSDDHEVWTI